MTELASKLIEWAEINSHSLNVSGLDQMRSVLKSEFEDLAKSLDLDLEISEPEAANYQYINEKGELVEFKLAKSLSVRRKSKEAKCNIFLGGHMDTVYPIDHPFQKCTQIDANTLNGPGVSDLKGGLIVLIDPGVLPSMLLASSPTARTFPDV